MGLSPKSSSNVELNITGRLGAEILMDRSRHDLLEILDDRYQSGSTLVTSRLPVEHWHDSIGDPTLADAILDRLIHNAYRLTIDGESMRKKQRLTPIGPVGVTSFYPRRYAPPAPAEWPWTG